MYVTTHNFRNYLEYSINPELIQKDIETIKKLFPDAVRIEKTPTNKDDGGVDYWVYLEGKRYGIDIKRRTAGCSKFWKEGPELALELWSNVEKRQIGWTLDESKKTDIVIFIFDDSDFEQAIWFWFKELLAVFQKQGRNWYDTYFSQYQKTFGINEKWYHSRVLFVPFIVVWTEIRKARKSRAFLFA